jgi:hypothetical protein
VRILHIKGNTFHANPSFLLLQVLNLQEEMAC